jgi:hypothetical protein
MKKVILLALLMPFTAFGQIVENFESGISGNWVQSPTDHWEVDSVTALSGNYSLHHSFDNTDAGIDRTGIPVRDLYLAEGNTIWSFLVRYGYDPSSSNNWSVFLISDCGPGSMSPGEGTSGFAVGVNLAGYDDTLRLWKVKSGEATTVIKCLINWQNDIGTDSTVKIFVERSQEGLWTLQVFNTNGDLLVNDSGKDPELFSFAWFGIYYRYTSTCDRLLWLDDIIIEGVFHEDNEAPFVVNCNVLGKNSIEIQLNEEPAADFNDPGNFSLAGGDNSPSRVFGEGTLTYILEFESELNNKSENTLLIDHLCDNSGNCSFNTQVPFESIWAEPGDVIISEIMADPVPEVSLPGKEYIELTNRTGFSFNMKDWNLVIGGQSVIIPDFNIGPSEIVIICSLQDTSLFSEFGRVLGLRQFPPLTDGGKIIYLADSYGNLIHGVEYSSDWYGDELKSGGGWSLEMIDTDYPFFYERNWKTSVSRKGGTPGIANSVASHNPDDRFYGIENVFPDDSVTLRVRFSEPVLSLCEELNEIKISGKDIIYIKPVDPLYREFILKVEDPLKSRNLYMLEFSAAITDFSGNPILKSDFSFGMPESAELHDLLFNELLFNPFPGDPDYIELFNTSEKCIDASRLILVSVNDGTGDTSLAYLLSVEKRCILPGTYYAVTTDKAKILERYFSAGQDYLFEAGSIPSMTDDKGHVVLFNKELDLIDEVTYNEKMHSSLLSGYEGVALEKTNPLNRSEDKVNWHSATETSGWGTPGAPNSIFIEVPVTSEEVIFSSTKISPDNDGIEDLLVIKLNLAGAGSVVSATVFDETGRYINRIAENLLAGPEATLIWDGTADDGTFVRTGIYIVFITLYDETGKTRQWKKVCTVIRN